MAHFGIKEWLIEVSLGSVPNTEIWQAFGERTSMGTTVTGEDIWRGAATSLPTPPGAGERMTLVSSDNADNGATVTGVLTVKIYYLDGSGVEQTEIIALDGTTPVHTIATDISFVNKMHAETVGPNGVAEGDIIIYQFGTPSIIYNLISQGGNMSMVPSRKIPAGKKLVLMEWHATEASSATPTKRVAFRIRSTDMDGVLKPGIFLFKGVSYLTRVASGDMDVRVLIPSLSIIKITGWADTSGAEASCGWWGVLCDN